MNYKHILSIILVFALCFGICSVALADETAEVPEGYTPIYTAEDMNNIRNDLSGKYILMNDIDLLSYESWEPVGSSETPFTGEFDGNGYSLFNMTIKGEYDGNDSLYFGLFAKTSNCTVVDLSLLNVDIDIKYVGDRYETFRAGALSASENGSAIERCIVSGSINTEDFRNGFVGGLFGTEYMSSLSDCVNRADVNYSSEKVSDVSIGGIAGRATNIFECCNYGDITVSSADSDDNCVYVGGIAGKPHQFGCLINNCYNRGAVEADLSVSSAYIGGIMGESYQFSNSYNSGEIILSDNFKGFAGGISGNFCEMIIAMYPGYDTENAYYINEGFCPAYSDGSVRYDDEFDNVKLLTEEEFRLQESFVGFDFENVWEMEENGYPVLKNQPELPESIPERPTTEPTTESTTESTTEPTTESTTESTTEPTTEPITEPINNVKNAEIIYVPLKNRIVFSFGSPALPDGIILKLVYNDGTEKIETVVRKDFGYFAGDESVFGAVDTEEVRYGCQTATLYINDERTSVEYAYFVIPPIFTILRTLFERTIWI